MVRRTEEVGVRDGRERAPGGCSRAGVEGGG